MGPRLGGCTGRRPARSRGGAGAIALHKRLFDLAARTTLDEQLELEAQMQSAAARSADFAEGVAAFREKRPPRFGGG